MNVLVKISGPFRSGTNLMKFVLQENYLCKPMFNIDWWKHSLPPVNVVDEYEHWRPDYHSIVMVKNPFKWCRSIYSFYCSSRPCLVNGKSFSDFIRSDLIVHDVQHGATGPRLWFPTPIDYWNSFYFGWLSWKGNSEKIHFIDMEIFVEKTEEVCRLIERRICLTPRVPNESIILPMGPVLPSNDKMLARTEIPTFKVAKPELEAKDVVFIRNRIQKSVLKALAKQCITAST